MVPKIFSKLSINEVQCVVARIAFFHLPDIMRFYRDAVRKEFCSVSVKVKLLRCETAAIAKLPFQGEMNACLTLLLDKTLCVCGAN